MAHWAILIGINQYQFLQPLSFAQQDAQALRNFLVSEAGFSADHCVLLTDTSPNVQNRSTQPTKSNIQGWIEEMCRTQLQTGDLLWCFFSGHAVCEQGHDYLMPLDGDPDNVGATGLAIRSLFENFKTAPNSTVLTLLDMNRNQMGQTENNLGAQTLELAKELEIATILSCAVNEVSHESPRIRNGFFTAALLEGLRNHECSTIGTLSKYLSDALPQLCEHYWQVRQHPEAVLPTLESGFELILPQAPVRTIAPAPAKSQTQPPVQPSTSTRNGSTATAIPTTIPTTSQAVPPSSQSSPQSTTITPTPQEQSDSLSPTDGQPYGSLLSQFVGNPNFVRPVAPTDTPRTEPSHAQDVNAHTQGVNTQIQPPDSIQPEPPPTPPRKPVMTFKEPATIPPDDTSASDIPDDLFWRRLLVRGALGASVLLLGVFVFNPDMFAKQSSPKPTPSGVNSTIAPTPNPLTPGSPTPILAPINPLNAPTSQQLQSRGLLDEARAKLTFNQATPFAEAIRQARQVKKGDPSYTQALQDIDRWSLVMLDLAEGRAKRGRFETAIKTANLLEGNSAANQPAALAEERPEIRARARELANNWEIKRRQQQMNGQIITNAQQLIRAKQASSYHQAIGALRKIPPNQPGYLRSQELTTLWSAEMLRMAKERAAQGNFRDAIRAADLVPANAPNYTAAKESIALWRNRVPQ